MNFPEFFLKIRDKTPEDNKELFDYAVVVRQNKRRVMTEQPVKDVTVDHEQRKIYIWVD